MAKAKTVRAYGEWIVLKKEAAEQTGLIARVSDDRRPRGVILSLGDDDWYQADTGTLKVGDVVVYDPTNLRVTEEDGVQYLFIKRDAVMGVVE